MNLTWEVEFVPAAHDTDSSSTNTDSHSKLGSSSTAAQVNVTNMSVDVEPPRAFQIFYCEMQNYGPQRCRVKLVNGTAAEVSQEDNQNEEENQEVHDPLR